MSETESVQVSLSRGIEVDISTADRTGVFHGNMPQVPAVGERVWKFGGHTYEVVAVEWNVGRDDEISAEVTVERVAKWLPRPTSAASPSPRPGKRWR